MNNTLRKPTREMTNILCVEDDESLRLLLRDFLSSEGFQVFCFPSPRTALEFLETTPHRVHLLLSDFYLPDMNGIELAECANALLPKLPVILLSASEQLPELAAGLVFLAKSVPLAVLSNTIQRLIDSA